MKRKALVPSSSRHLKCAGSSLFPIATILEVDDLVVASRLPSSSSSSVSSEELPCLPQTIYVSTSSSTACSSPEPTEEGTEGVLIDDEGKCHPSVSLEQEVDEEVPKRPLLDDVTTTEGSESNETSKTSVKIKREQVDETDSDNHQQATDSISVLSPREPISKFNDCRTGLVFECGELHYDVRNRFHNERPIRITAIQEYLTRNDIGIEQRCINLHQRSHSSENVHTMAKDFLDDEGYLGVHLPGYMSRLDLLSTCTCQTRLDQEAEQFPSMYFTKDTVREAKRAAASLCALVSKVALGELDNGFAVVRPPGHHAEPGLAGGYCVINNIAVAAYYAKERLGCKKILIGAYVTFVSDLFIC